VSPREYEKIVAAYILSNGVTRCPTACAVPTQATITAADRSALARHASKRERGRERRIAARNRWGWTVGVGAPTGE
jgi:hypothetical protein